MPPNCVLVEGGWFCGKPATVRIHTRPDGLTPQLAPPPVELSGPERKALAIVRGIKGGCRPEYFDRAGLGAYGKLNPHIVMLRAKGLVNPTVA